MKKIIVVDNNDSFVYNLIEYLRKGGKCEFDVVLSDDIDLNAMGKYDGILLSPGADLPHHYPKMMELIDRCKLTHSIFGVCLGHQALASYFGAELIQLKEPKHGHCSVMTLKECNRLTMGVDSGCKIGRYHSWVVSPANLPSQLIVSAVDEDENIMMIRHRFLSIYGVQYHPESIMSEGGWKIIDNWVNIVGATHIEKKRT